MIAIVELETGQNCMQPAGVRWLLQRNGRLHEAPVAFTIAFDERKLHDSSLCRLSCIFQNFGFILRASRLWIYIASHHPSQTNVLSELTKWNSGMHWLLDKKIWTLSVNVGYKIRILVFQTSNRLQWRLLQYSKIGLNEFQLSFGLNWVREPSYTHTWDCVQFCSL